MSAAAPAPPRGSAPRRAAGGGRVLPFPVTGQELVLVGVIAVLWVVLGLATPAFLSSGSIVPLLVATAPIALIGIGVTVVIISGGIDVSVGSIVLVCAAVAATAMTASGLPLVPVLLLSVAVGGLLGLVNGVLVAYGRVHAIIITFGTLNIFRFVGLQVFGGSTIDGIPPVLAVFGRGEAGRTLGVPHSFLLVAVVAALAWVALRHTAGGRHYYAIGGDAQAARLAGIAVRPRVLLAYVLTGLLTGLAACFVIAQGTSTLAPNVGLGLELSAIAAVVIGGTSITGGRGSVLGTVLGALLVQTVASGIIQLGWPSQLSSLFIGVFIIVAVGVDLLRQRRRRSA
ncbi:ABC transporter permease [uncultured Pseudokineococcus sp.]|uniref:ABC transporter permease n=1 Tax=uncultured Pseudokineococcus sp. TaxID=1642928 RepID=UPI002633110B|nr:ABC transporter permease [uncultured Pseudokineococcus sp.]